MKTPSWFLKKSFMAWLLLPASALYLFISRVVFISRGIGKKSSKKPVICIGGLLAGGVGKTPIVREIASKLGAAVVMRGYHGGDEAKMLGASGLAVFVGKDRRDSIKTAEKAGFSSIVMDDGFQNPTIKKDISVLVFDSGIGVGNGFVLPAGPMREPLSAIRRADAVIIIWHNGRRINHDLVEKIKRYKKPVFFAENETIIPRGIDKFIAFAGIGYPQKFFGSLPKKPVKTVFFPDHHQFSPSDIKDLFAMARCEKAGLLTTEKDWVRLSPAARKKIQFSPLKTTIEPDFYSWLKTELKKIKR